jgi:hypothetical protein
VYFISRLLSVVLTPVYFADCGGNSPIIIPPMEEDTVENCGGIPIPEPIPEITDDGTEASASKDAE